MILSVAGMMLRGCALVLVAFAFVALLAPPDRDDRWWRLLAAATWIFLAAASVVATAYLWELLAALTSSNRYERFTFWEARAGGPYALAYWFSFALALLPQLLWLARVRRRLLSVLLIAGASLLPSIMERLIVAFRS
jgi:hypothetical protein